MLKAAIGLTVKSGWAAAVLLTGSPSSPRVADSRRIELSDPAIPESRQPYHHGFGTARASGPELSRLVDSVRRFGRKSVTGLFREYSSSGHRLTGVGVVVGSLIDPDSIANEHIRIHAMEGQLFREVVTGAARKRGFTCAIFRERDLMAEAARTLKQSDASLRRALAECDRAAGAPWRAEQKNAALAAWLVIARRSKGSHG